MRAAQFFRFLSTNSTNSRNPVCLHVSYRTTDIYPSGTNKWMKSLLGWRTRLSPKFIPAGTLRHSLMNPAPKSASRGVADPSSGSSLALSPEAARTPASYALKSALRCVLTVFSVVTNVVEGIHRLQTEHLKEGFTSPARNQRREY